MASGLHSPIPARLPQPGLGGFRFHAQGMPATGKLREVVDDFNRQALAAEWADGGPGASAAGALLEEKVRVAGRFAIYVAVEDKTALRIFTD